MISYQVNPRERFFVKEHRPALDRSMSGLSNNELIAKIKKLGITERKTLLSILACLIEIERRRLYLSQGYNSLYDFCVRSLRFSESSAVRKVHTARCLRDYPELYGMILSGDLNISSVSKISRILTPGNSRKLFAEIAGRSAREVDTIVARYRPRSSVPDLVRPVFIMSKVEARAEGDKKFTANVGGKKSCTKQHDSGSVGGICELGGRSNGQSESAGNTEYDDKMERDGNNADNSSKRVTMTRRFKLEFGVDPAFMNKLDRVRSLLSTKHPRKLEFERLFEILMDEYLERNAPESRTRKREERKRRSSDNNIRQDAGKERQASPKSADKKCCKNNNNAGQADKRRRSSSDPDTRSRRTSDPDARSRHIPQSLQDKIYIRDKGRCTFVGEDGKRCNSQSNLQIDHKVPYARGGTHTLDNLRLLCGKHNRLEAEKAYGRDFMKRFRRRE